MNPSLNDSMRGRRLDGNVRFDRLNPEPPRYLDSLRAVGHQRWTSYWRNFGAATRRAVDKGWLPENRGCYVDAGCGHSADAHYARKWLGFSEPVKIDLFPPYANRPETESRLRDFEENAVRFIQGDICKLTDYLPTGSADMIGCSAVLDLMHACDRDLFYEEAYRVLRPGGIMAASYLPLAHGYSDWGFRERMTMEMDIGFDCMEWSDTMLIARKPQ